MMLNIREELERLLEKYPDPQRGGEGLLEYDRRQDQKTALPVYGVVADNKDPQCLGRLRVASDMIAPGAVTGWIPFLALGAANKTGFWQLPDIGTQVLVGFEGNTPNRPVVLGCVYDLKGLPPEHSTKKAADSIVYQTKNHRLEIIDEEGKESIIISTAKGKIRYSLTTGKGIEIVNELGDIKIKCRKLTIEGGKGVTIQGEKKVRISGEDAIKIAAKKSVKMGCEKEVKIKGKNIKLNASKGITTEGKQLAAEGSKVMGFDIHQMVIPAGTSTAVVPLPHPYIGKLVDKLSDNVKINGHNAAVKGSKSKHDDTMHMQLPGTIKFNNQPNKEGEVTGGTGKKVKINGKEAAVIGSTVTTCNDTGARDNSTVMAAGASIPMPVIINPKNMKEYELEREEQETRKPEFTTVKWGKGSVEEGEEIELTAQVKDIEDGNMATFQVWREGQDPAVHTAMVQLPAAIEGGTAKGEWGYRHPEGRGLPEGDPKFYFTVHSAWCPLKKSDTLTVVMKRPELSEAKWLDQDGKQTDKGLVGETVKLRVTCNKDMEEGAGVVFRVYRAGSNPERDQPAAERGAENRGGKAEAEWTYHYRHDPDKPLKEKPKYFFTADGRRCKRVKSGDVEISQKISLRIENRKGEAQGKIRYEIYTADGSLKSGESDTEGKGVEEGLIPGVYDVLIRKEKDGTNE